jgi:hypothetical protein
MLTRVEAAAYCGMKVKGFEFNCPCRPSALPDGGTAYDIHELDRWLDSIKGGGATNGDEYLSRLE